ncbi:MAG: hypothetical protein KJ626_14765 [Verrucomicrobia bacterium]|nr:hypothetical protein [Verrucomicrobiota bacterium]
MKYEEVTSFYDQKRDHDLSRVRGEYLSELQRFEREAMSSGALQDGELYRAEQRRFRSSGGIGEADFRNDLPALRDLQQHYLGLFDSIINERYRNIEDISGQYVTAVRALGEEFGEAGNKEAHDACRREQERVKNSGEYAEAKAALAEIKAKAERMAQQGSSEGSGSGASLYIPGDEPQMKLRNHSAYYTGPHSRAILSPASINLSSYEVSRRFVREEWAQNKVINRAYEATRFVPRIYCSATAEEGVRDAELVIEYVVRNKSDRKNAVVERVEYVDLPDLPFRKSVVVDAGGILLSDNDYVYQGENGQPVYIVAKEVEGIIVSLFGPGDRLLYQRCTRSAVAKYASPLKSAPADQRDLPDFQSP